MEGLPNRIEMVLAFPPEGGFDGGLKSMQRLWYGSAVL